MLCSVGGVPGDAGDGSGGSVSGRDARLARVADRAVAAGLEAWRTQFRNPKTGQGEGPYGMHVFLPSGQRFRGVSLNGGDEADVLLKFPFERWTALQGYEAILDPNGQRIVAEVTLLGTSLSKVGPGPFPAGNCRSPWPSGGSGPKLSTRQGES
jgi:hypothetical protein